jgi:hypothetical protein
MLAETQCNGRMIWFEVTTRSAVNRDRAQCTLIETSSASREFG